MRISSGTSFATVKAFVVHAAVRTPRTLRAVTVATIATIAAARPEGVATRGSSGAR
jgi:hypothetical protein